ncbi:hypothetical protein, partial [Fusicatenibacter saccharivorans]|uniref:hypothetical protein n=1 Tax=Fusicatenibacter saccharivorans TaxID=1150298 RepID=UPI001A9A88F0
AEWRSVPLERMRSSCGICKRSPPGIITNIHKNSFLYYHEIFYFAMHIPFQTLLFLFPFSENCNQRGAPENFFSNAPLRFLFFCQINP